MFRSSLTKPSGPTQRYAAERHLFDLEQALEAIRAHAGRSRTALSDNRLTPVLAPRPHVNSLSLMEK